MNNPFLLLPLLGLLVTLATPASADVTERLKKGEVIVNEKKLPQFSSPGVKAVGVIKAPMEKLWPLIDRCANYKTTMLLIDKAREISRKGNEVLCEITVDLPFPLDDITCTTKAIHTEQPGKMYKRAWSLVSGDYEYNEGSWTLVPFQGSATETLLVYETQVQPNTMIPDALRSFAQKKTIPNLYEHLEKQALKR